MTALLSASYAFAFPAPHDGAAEASPRGTSTAHDVSATRTALKAKLRNVFMEARAAKARYDLPKLLSLFKDCRSLALGMGNMRAARACGEGTFGVAKRLGDARTMVEADYWWQQHGFSASDKTSAAYSAFQAADLVRLVDTVPVFSAQVADSASVLKYQHRIEFAGR